MRRAPQYCGSILLKLPRHLISSAPARAGGSENNDALADLLVCKGVLFCRGEKPRINIFSNL